MMHRLKITLEPLPHPYVHESSSQFDRWGKIRIAIAPQEGEENENVLYESQWNLAVFAEWFAEHDHELCNEELRITGQEPRHGESIAAAQQRFRSEWIQQSDIQSSNHVIDDDTDDTFKWFVALDAYQERHNLRDASQGLAMPPIYIGVNHGVGEISVVTEDAEWAHTFDMDDFCTDFRDRLSHLVEEWHQVDLNADVRTLVGQLLHRLGEGKTRPA